MNSSEMIKAVRITSRDESWIDTVVARKLIDEFARLPTSSASDDASNLLIEDLSGRELDILRLLTKGSRNRDIARNLHLAEGTVKNYISSLMRKLQVRDRTQAVARAKELGLL